MTQIQSFGLDSITQPSSPFDLIKHADEYGDWWDGRELMPCYGYGADWRNFLGCIEGARTAALNNGLAVDTLFVEINEKTGGRPRQNFKLRRHAAYLVAMEGDPSKPQIASAKHYFATRTQEAELLDDMDRDLRLIVKEAMALQETRREVERLKLVQQRQGERQDVLEARVDSIEGRSDWYTAMAYCKVNHLPCHLAYRTKLGVAGSKIAKQADITLPKVPDERFGTVNKYPKWVLDKALEQMETANAGA